MLGSEVNFQETKRHNKNLFHVIIFCNEIALTFRIRLETIAIKGIRIIKGSREKNSYCKACPTDGHFE
jgi:hypothetical protein